MNKIEEKISWANKVLQTAGIAEPLREAKSLLAFALQKDLFFLIAHNDYSLSAKEAKLFDDIVFRRSQREPFQYITGKQEFYGLDFEVNRNVLIPRPETEIIVEQALQILSEKAVFCEVGIGSGCLSITILYHLKNTFAIGLDISGKALEISRRNAVKHNVDNRLQLQRSDVFTTLTKEKFDLIISNPPYISSAEISTLQPEVKDFEPLSALTDGQNGLSIIEKLILQAPIFLKPQSFLLIEIGFNQSQDVSRLINPDIWQASEFLHDLQNIPRTLKLQLR